MDGDSQVAREHERESFSGCRAKARAGPITTMPAVLAAVEYLLPAFTQGPIGPRVDRPACKNHGVSSRGFPDWRAERMQHLGLKRKLS